MDCKKRINDGFTFSDREQPETKYSSKPKPTNYFAKKSLTLSIGCEEKNDKLNFRDAFIVDVNDEGQYKYEALNIGGKVYLVTIHMLEQNPSRNLSIIVDFDTNLVTKIDSIVTEIEPGSTRIVEGSNLVTRDIGFGYINSTKNPPSSRHHFTGDLVDKVIRAENGFDSSIMYYIHSRTKISYYQKEWPESGNPIDKDGVGYGELSTIKITNHIYILTFTKHSHGNQPLLVWNAKENRMVGNFFGISRQSGCIFLVTGGFFTKTIY